MLVRPSPHTALQLQPSHHSYALKSRTLWANVILHSYIVSYCQWHYCQDKLSYVGSVFFLALTDTKVTVELDEILCNALDFAYE